MIGKIGCFLSSLIFFGLCSFPHSRAAIEIIKSGKCGDFYEDSQVAKDAPWWGITADSCSVCNQENSQKSWFLTKFLNTKNAELLHVAITVSFTQCEQCPKQHLKVLAAHEKLPMHMDSEIKKQKLDSLTVLKEIKNEKSGTKKTHHIQVASRSDGVSIVLLAEGACLIVHEFKVTSFVCEEASIDGVRLPRTVTPASENRIVNASCVKDTAPSGSRVIGLCGSDGEWKYVTPCFCEEGYTFGSKGCESCKRNTYKDNVSNEPCRPCPLNSESAPMASRCECKKGYYRVPGSSYAEPCHGIPSSARQLQSLPTRDAKSLVIHWQPPLRAINDVSYDIECFRCVGEVCELPCGDKTTFHPSRFNVTRLSVVVENLMPNTHYMFAVRSKNNNSYLINQNNWLSVRERFETGDACNDESKECAGYKDLGYCAPSHPFHECMKTTCPKACGFCQVSCEDQDRNCSGWKTLCDIVSYVQNSCKKTCGSC